eukprot:CFRG1192T1
MDTCSSQSVVSVAAMSAQQPSPFSHDIFSRQVLSKSTPGLGKKKTTRKPLKTTPRPLVFTLPQEADERHEGNTPKSVTPYTLTTNYTCRGSLGSVQQAKRASTADMRMSARGAGDSKKTRKGIKTDEGKASITCKQMQMPTPHISKGSLSSKMCNAHSKTKSPKLDCTCSQSDLTSKQVQVQVQSQTTHLHQKPQQMQQHMAQQLNSKQMQNQKKRKKRKVKQSYAIYSKDQNEHNTGILGTSISSTQHQIPSPIQNQMFTPCFATTPLINPNSQSSTLHLDSSVQVCQKQQIGGDMNIHKMASPNSASVLISSLLSPVPEEISITPQRQDQHKAVDRNFSLTSHDSDNLQNGTDSPKQVLDMPSSSTTPHAPRYNEHDQNQEHHMCPAQKPLVAVNRLRSLPAELEYTIGLESDESDGEQEFVGHFSILPGEKMNGWLVKATFAKEIIITGSCNAYVTQIGPGRFQFTCLKETSQLLSRQIFRFSISGRIGKKISENHLTSVQIFHAPFLTTITSSKIKEDLSSPKKPLTRKSSKETQMNNSHATSNNYIGRISLPEQQQSVASTGNCNNYSFQNGSRYRFGDLAMPLKDSNVNNPRNSTINGTPDQVNTMTKFTFPSLETTNLMLDKDFFDSQSMSIGHQCKDGDVNANARANLQHASYRNHNSGLQNGFPTGSVSDLDLNLSPFNQAMSSEHPFTNGTDNQRHNSTSTKRILDRAASVLKSKKSTQCVLDRPSAAVSNPTAQCTAISSLDSIVLNKPPKIEKNHGLSSLPRHQTHLNLTGMNRLGDMSSTDLGTDTSVLQLNQSSLDLLGDAQSQQGRHTLSDIHLLNSRTIRKSVNYGHADERASGVTRHASFPLRLSSLGQVMEEELSFEKLEESLRGDVMSSIMGPIPELDLDYSLHGERAANVNTKVNKNKNVRGTSTEFASLELPSLTCKDLRQDGNDHDLNLEELSGANAGCAVLKPIDTTYGNNFNNNSYSIGSIPTIIEINSYNNSNQSSMNSVDIMMDDIVYDNFDGGQMKDEPSNGSLSSSEFWLNCDHKVLLTGTGLGWEQESGKMWDS